MRRSDFNIYHLFFTLLLAVSGLIRFIDLGDFSLSNDELSALSRLDYESVNELIVEGVLKTDPHPAGGQLFLYYWTDAFGISPFAVRFPFVLAGLISLIFFYLLISKWFGSQNALLATTFFAMIEFTNIHSQLARPYALGLMFCMMFVWAWYKLLFENQRLRVYSILYLLSGIAALYLHYYAGLFVGIVGIAGLFHAYQTKRLKFYMVLNMTIVLLFLPHLRITIRQITGDGGISWIPDANWEFIKKHFSMLMNKSILLPWIFLGAFFTSGFFFVKGKLKNLRLVILGVIFYTAPFLFGLLYSALYTPILMDRALLFSTPFLFAIVFSHIPNLKKALFIPLYFFFVVMLIASLVMETTFFERRYTENFKGIAAGLDQFSSELGREEMLLIGNYNAPSYLNFYVTGTPPIFSMDKIESDVDLANFMALIRAEKRPFLFLSWACRYQSPELVEYAKRYFPNTLDEAYFYNSGFWMMEREFQTRDTVIYMDYLSETDFTNDSSFTEHSLSADEEFLNLFQLKLNDHPEVEILNIDLRFSAEDLTEAVLVSEIKDTEGKSVFWMGKKLKDFQTEENWNELFSCILLKEKKHKSDEVFFYLWNPGLETIGLKEITLTSFGDSHYPDQY